MQALFFANNRKKLISSIQGGLAIFAGNTSMQASNDAAFPFAQEANFWWLSGIHSPDWWLIVDGRRGQSWLVYPEISENHQIFDGSLSVVEAAKLSGVEHVISQKEALPFFRELSRQHSIVYSLGEHPHSEYLDFTFNPAGKKMWERLDRTFNGVHDCRLELSQLRAIKQSEEIKAIKKAVALTVATYKDVYKRMGSFKSEYEIEAEFTYHFRRAGAYGHAYEPIIAAGKNACTLHYNQNTAKLRPHQLVLMDVGVRIDGYVADISRTYATSELTKRQQAIHDEVCEAHRTILKLLRPGLLVSEYQSKVDDIMKNVLLRLGLLKDSNDQDTYRRYFPHAISHGLGVDVHDSLAAPKTFRANMVLTVEPGIYIPEEGIGVRIEDNILITQKGATNLSAGLSTDY